jgi:glycosyltransferase involved in cell wall biosynthesis
LPHHSLARVNRELGRALAALDVVDVIPQGEPTANVEATIGVVPRRIEDVPPAVTAFTIKHGWPPIYRRPKHGYSIHIQPYEYGAIPQPWIDRSLELADDVWCYTEYVKQLYVDAGMPADRACVIPLGFDPSVYHPGIAPYDVGSDSTFIFLFVGGTIWRKGIDTLLDAYLSAFGPGDDVMLVIKDVGSATSYLNNNYSERINELAQRSDVPMIRYTAGNMSDGGLASLFRRADVLVHPYRGEGFGLPVLEAMACGTVPIVTLGGATDDFVNDDIGYRLPARRLDLGTSFAGLEHARNGWALDVDPAVLARSMRDRFEQRAETQARGARAAAFVHGAFTWAHSAHRAAARLNELAQRAPRVHPGEESFTAYELRATSRNGEDGLFMELFGRLRVTEPFLVEFGAAADSNGAALAERIGWGSLRVAVAPPAAAAAQLLRDNNVAVGFDLLAIADAQDAAALWQSVASYRPRAVVVQAAPLDGLMDVARAEGYAFLGRDTSESSAFFVRRDLLALSGFPERT